MTTHYAVSHGGIGAIATSPLLHAQIQFHAAFYKGCGELGYTRNALKIFTEQSWAVSAAYPVRRPHAYALLICRHI
jgi:hypothetical protein